MIAALTSFFRVQKTGADVEEKRLDKVMGLAVIARAGACPLFISPSCDAAWNSSAISNTLSTYTDACSDRLLSCLSCRVFVSGEV
jgi:hypothetical protein